MHLFDVLADAPFLLSPTYWLRARPAVALLAVNATAGLLAGLLGGGAVVAVGSAVASVRVSFGVAAARALGTDYDRVAAWQRFLVGWAGAAGVGLLAGLLVGVATPLVDSLVAHVTVLVVLAEFVTALALALGTGWWLVAVRWRSLAPHDAPGAARARRGWAVLSVAYAGLAAVGFPPLYLFLSLAVFWP